MFENIWFKITWSLYSCPVTLHSQSLKLNHVSCTLVYLNWHETDQDYSNWEEASFFHDYRASLACRHTIHSCRCQPDPSASWKGSRQLCPSQTLSRACSAGSCPSHTSCARSGNISLVDLLARSWCRRRRANFCGAKVDQAEGFTISQCVLLSGWVSRRPSHLLSLRDTSFLLFHPKLSK